MGFKCCFNRELFKINDIIMCRYVISSYLSWYNCYVLIIPLVSEEFSFETLLCLQFSFIVLPKTNSELRVKEEM